MSLMEAPVQRSVLQVHGAHDPMVLPASVDGSEDYVRAPYQRVDLPCGHFPHEEAPDAFDARCCSLARRAAEAVTPERPRDALGRPLPADVDPALVEPGVPDRGDVSGAGCVAPGDRRTSTRACPFHAHEVFEARWRVAPAAERAAWRALAQWGAALTHAARGNPVGARRLAERAETGLAEAGAVPSCIDVGRVLASCERMRRPRLAGPQPGEQGVDHARRTSSPDRRRT